MMQLLRIERSRGFRYTLHDIGVDIRVLEPMPYRDDADMNPTDTYEFFLVEDQFIPMVVESLARKHPGREVSVWTLQSTSIAPAGPVVTRRVTEDGLLPD